MLWQLSYPNSGQMIKLMHLMAKGCSPEFRSHGQANWIFYLTLQFILVSAENLCPAVGFENHSFIQGLQTSPVSCLDTQQLLQLAQH